LFPTSLFFRTAYSESLFLLLTILFLYAMVRTWPFVLIATIAGMATATRPVGVAFLVPLTIHLWHRSVGVRQFVRNVALLTPLACWGPAVYMIYQSTAFAAPLAFVRPQAQCTTRPPSPVPGDRLVSLLTGEPIWGVLAPASPYYWAKNS